LTRRKISGHSTIGFLRLDIFSSNLRKSRFPATQSLFVVSRVLLAFLQLADGERAQVKCQPTARVPCGHRWNNSFFPTARGRSSSPGVTELRHFCGAPVALLQRSTPGSKNSQLGKTKDYRYVKGWNDL
jgi:hypothetical protein